jgi:putative integral membrane protein (TIGR02587 family)
VIDQSVGSAGGSSRHPRLRQQITAELEDFAHGAAGGFLFGVPLLFTMEMWFTGTTISMTHAGLLVALTVFISAIFVITIGFRETGSPRPRDVMSETIDAVGISLVVTVVCLLMLGRITQDTPLDVLLGRIAIELLPVSLGVAIANHILPRQGSRQGDEEDRDAQLRINPTIRDLVAATAGALLLSLNIAPTDEVIILASELDEVRLVALMIFSLLVTYMIVFEAEFGGQRKRHSTRGVLQRPITETVVAYLVALAVCAGTMYLVGALSNDLAFGTILSRTIVLGFPGALGAAAGRLAV